MVKINQNNYQIKDIKQESSSNINLNNVFNPWYLIVYFLICLMAICILLYFLSDVLLPFVVGAFMAYLLRPINNKLIYICPYKTVNAVLCVIIFFSILALIFINVIPVFVNQLIVFINNFAAYMSQVAMWLELPINTTTLEDISQNTLWNLMDIDFLTNIMFSSQSWHWLWDSGYQMLYFLYLMIITPIATFYILNDWQQITSALSSFLEIFVTNAYRTHIQKLFTTIDDSLSSFAHGQFLIIIIMSMYYIFMLTMLGLTSAVFIGLLSSIVIFIPYFGPMFSISLASVVTIGQFSTDYVPFVLVLIIYFIGQVLEDLILFPILLGKKMRLHPLLVILTVFVFARMFGIIGVWIAIPFVAIIKSLLIYIVFLYHKNKKSVSQSHIKQIDTT